MTFVDADLLTARQSVMQAAQQQQHPRDCFNGMMLKVAAGYRSFGPSAQCVVHALKGLALAEVTKT